MTEEKSLVASWSRTPGYASDTEDRAFAQALARKRVRFAFPDDFTLFAKKLQVRLADKHEKGSDEGRALRALREIRVHAAPTWESPTVELFFWFMRGDEEADFEGKSWSDLLKEWLKLVPASGPFQSVEGQVAALGDMTAAEYVGSDSLDLDHLSSHGSE